MITCQEVGRVLDADRDADEVVGQATRRAQGGRDAGVAHVAGQADQAGHAAKADRDLEKPRLLRDHSARFHAAQGHHRRSPSTEHLSQAAGKPRHNAAHELRRVEDSNHMHVYIIMQ